jgi:hypothetical protein
MVNLGERFSETRRVACFYFDSTRAAVVSVCFDVMSGISPLGVPHTR